MIQASSFIFRQKHLLKMTHTHLPAYTYLSFVSQRLAPSNSSGLEDEAEMRENMMELLRRSILYIEPVDPVYWCGALLKCEGRILPCLRVRDTPAKV